jgi:DnaJ homolog subfamily C member 19
MAVFAAFIAAMIGWALFTGRLKAAYLPPLVFGLIGAAILAKGHPLIGGAGIALSLAWFQGMRLRMGKASRKFGMTVDKARALLGVTARDEADHIRAVHRILIAQCHPDKAGDGGGNAARAAELNQARDLLLNNLSKPRD